MKFMLRIFLLILIAVAFAPGARAQDFDFSAFETLPVLHEGRIKPLDSFARNHLHLFSGRNSGDGISAPQWLAEALFDPAQAAERPLFLLRDPALKNMLGLSAQENRFSLVSLQSGLARTAPELQSLLGLPEGELTAAQRQLLELHNNALAFTELLRSLSMILPLNIDIPEKYAKNMPATPVFGDLIAIEQNVIADLKTLIRKKGEDPARYSDEEKRLAQLGFQIQILRAGGENNSILRILLPVRDKEGAEWTAPWTLAQGAGSPLSEDYLALWRDMAKAYRAGDVQGWVTASKQTRAFVQENFREHIFSSAKLRLEIFYNKLRPFHAAAALYGLSLALLLAAARRTSARLRLAGMAACGLGIFLHAAGLAARVIILARPPVGTLYESALFVGLICAGLGLLSARRARSAVPLAIGAGAGAFLLLLAPALAPRGENLEMLVAVLNTNFWLMTHVLCITAGYGVCILASCTAHGYMFARAQNPNAQLQARLQQSAYYFSLGALLLTAVGTVLGGIWADQSWGRFWGWDPKENGALLIVLWLIWIQHGRLSGHLRMLPFMAMLAALNIIVALAWFGVNLLNVGLHSYGFITGIAAGLSIFCAAEILLIAALWIYIRRRERSAHHAV